MLCLIVVLYSAFLHKLTAVTKIVITSLITFGGLKVAGLPIPATVIGAASGGGILVVAGRITYHYCVKSTQ